jgi:hypothetical protein
VRPIETSGLWCRTRASESVLALCRATQRLHKDGDRAVQLAKGGIKAQSTCCRSRSRAARARGKAQHRRAARRGPWAAAQAGAAQQGLEAQEGAAASRKTKLRMSGWVVGGCSQWAGTFRCDAHVPAGTALPRGSSTHSPRTAALCSLPNRQPASATAAPFGPVQRMRPAGASPSTGVAASLTGWPAHQTEHATMARRRKRCASLASCATPPCAVVSRGSSAPSLAPGGRNPACFKPAYSQAGPAPGGMAGAGCKLPAAVHAHASIPQPPHLPPPAHSPAGPALAPGPARAAKPCGTSTGQGCRPGDAATGSCARVGVGGGARTGKGGGGGAGA